MKLRALLFPVCLVLFLAASHWTAFLCGCREGEESAKQKPKWIHPINASYLVGPSAPTNQTTVMWNDHRGSNHWLHIIGGPERPTIFKTSGTNWMHWMEYNLETDEIETPTHAGKEIQFRDGRKWKSVYESEYASLKGSNDEYCVEFSKDGYGWESLYWQGKRIEVYARTGGALNGKKFTKGGVLINP